MGGVERIGQVTHSEQHAAKGDGAFVPSSNRTAVERSADAPSSRVTADSMA